MLFKRKASFFLDLSGDAPGDQPTVTIAPPVEQATPQAGTQKPDAPSATVPAMAPLPAGNQPAGNRAADNQPAASLTTAEAIAAELAAAEASRPPASMATFAPECLTPGGGQPVRRRRGGANLAGFRSMAKSMMGK
ncbi:MAG: hypothetical protein ACK5E6_02265 [Cyanobacteriota bacterium]|jgi:hypothetical protein